MKKPGQKDSPKPKTWLQAHVEQVGEKHTGAKHTSNRHMALILLMASFEALKMVLCQWVPLKLSTLISNSPSA
jgi:hypothetical protein